MSALGNYIHYKFANYQEYGTFKGTGFQQGQSNYNTEVFNNFKDKVIQQARQKLKVSFDIKTLEENFNKARNERIQVLKSLSKNDPTWINFVQRILEGAKLDQKLNANEVAKYIGFDDNNSLIIKNIYGAKGLSIEKISAKERSYLKTLLNRCKIGFQIINTISDDHPDKAKMKKDLMQVAIHLGTLKKTSKTEQFSLSTMFKGTTFQKMPVDQTLTSYLSKGGNVMIPDPYNQIILQEIENIVGAATLASVLSNLQGSLEEVLGAMIGPMIQNYAFNWCEEEIINSFNALTKSQITGLNQSSMGLSIEPMVKFYNKELEQWAKNNKRSVMKLPDGTLTLSLDYETENKADFHIGYDGKAYGVSAKSYDLSRKWDNEKDHIPAAIGLQSGTNLLAYCLAAQRFENEIGNHFLNIFSVNNTFNQASYEYLKNSARDSFAIFLLYSALTGDILKNQDNAQIFYVYDKSKELSSDVSSRVHFFRIQDIIEDILKQSYEVQMTNMQITPNLNTLKLANKFQILHEGYSIGEAVQARITKVLLEARKTKFNIKLNHSYINNIIKEGFK